MSALFPDMGRIRLRVKVDGMDWQTYALDLHRCDRSAQYGLVSVYDIYGMFGTESTIFGSFATLCKQWRWEARRGENGLLSKLGR